MADRGRRSGPATALVVLGAGLALAPAIFGMFGRAPAGGRMIDDFRPHMTEARLEGFRADLTTISAARDEVATTHPAGGEAAPIAELVRAWPGIEAEMSSMVDTIEANLDRYRGLAALPPFWAFPWFFVIPGVLIAALGAAQLRGWGGDRNALRVALVALGVGLIAAPAVFQMFTRAPGGARMIDDFRPLMTTDRIAAVQRHFLVIGAAEAPLRTVVLPATEASATDLPATEAFVREWPRMAADMAPMIGAMADNLDAFAGVDALPPFWLFPWFFVVPGLAVVGLAVDVRLPRLGTQPAPVLERSPS